MTDRTVIAINAAQEASKRARWVFLLMQIASILVFVAVWHSLWNGWSLTRLRSAQAAVRYLTCSTGSNKQPLPPECQAVDSDELAQGKRVVEAWKWNRAEAEEQVRNLQHTLASNVLVITVPVLGVTFDVNDLSVLASISFLLLLGWFRFCLWREEQNTKAVFERARRGNELAEVYDLYAMTQVLTIPPAAGGSGGFWSKVSDYLTWTPVFVTGLVLVHDIASIGLANLLSTTLGAAQAGFGLLCFGFLAWLSFECGRIGRAIDLLWESAFAEKQEIAGELTRGARAGDRNL